MKPAIQFKKHNHRDCIDQAISRAEHLCNDQDLRLTAIRRKILELVWSSHMPVAAYDLLKELRKEKSNAEPPTVYRALEFLIENGMIHKIESLNAYVGCPFSDEHHISQFLICSNCMEVVELNNQDIGASIQDLARSLTGFQVSQQTVEIKGLCPTCQKL